MLSCVGDETNQQLTGPQKELLLWHWKLGVGMKHVQDLVRPRKYKVGDEEITADPIIPTKHATTRCCPIPMCMSCELAKAKVRTTGTKTTSVKRERDGVIKTDCYEPGDMVSSDQFNVSTSGRLLSGFGRESIDNGYHGGTIYVDAASGLVRVECQVSMGANETLLGKERFEQWVWDLATVVIKRYHSDHGIYDSKAFRDNCIEKKQRQTFSGVGAKHQNPAERAIQTIS
jgi:hypothetical protein